MPKIGLQGDPFKFDETGATVAYAAANQVEVDFKLDRLNQQHQSGKINDKQLIKGMEKLRQNIKKGPQGLGLRRDVRAEQVGAAQTIAGQRIADVGERQTEFLDDALRRWNEAQSGFTSGELSQDEFETEKDLYTSALEGKREEPTERGLVKKILKGKAFDRYKSGRMRSIQREKQIRQISKAEGADLGRGDVRKLAAGEGNLPFIRKQVRADKSQARDLEKERSVISELSSELGRLPTSQEVKERVYGQTI